MQKLILSLLGLAVIVVALSTIALNADLPNECACTQQHICLIDEPNEPEPENASTHKGIELLSDEPNEPEPECVSLSVWGNTISDDPNQPEPEIAFAG